MDRLILEAADCFDGQRFLGPSTIQVENGVFHAILHGTALPSESLPPLFFDPVVPRERAAFVMPPMAEAHCHIFLEGDELDDAKRAEHLKAPRETLLATARKNLGKYRDAGITVLRDAGDIHGVNLAVRAVARDMGMTIHAAGAGLRRVKRYGSFMANEVADDLVGAVTRLAENADVIKIILTGIIDFANGVVKGAPQFTLEETQLIVDTAHALGKKTFAHCSGLDGLRVAVMAGVDSIEHGFFMNREILEGMARGNLAWVPTILPVHFQWEHPQYGGWDDATRGRLRDILDNHAECLREAESLGIRILAGSDGGSFGVRHGAGLLEELRLLRETGLSAETVLTAATSAPRQHFGLAGGFIRPGEPAEYLMLPASPRADFSILQNAARTLITPCAACPPV